MDKSKFVRLEKFDIQFADTIAAGVLGEMSYDFNFGCSIEKMVITFPIGSHYELQIRPYLLRPDKGTIELIDYVGNRFVSGDNQAKPYSPSRMVEYGYKLVIAYNNIGADAHGFDIAVVCDPLFGSLRADAVKGVRK